MYKVCPYKLYCTTFHVILSSGLENLENFLQICTSTQYDFLTHNKKVLPNQSSFADKTKTTKKTQQKTPPPPKKNPTQTHKKRTKKSKTGVTDGMTYLLTDRSKSLHPPQLVAWVRLR